MGREIEIKIPLNDIEYDRILSLIMKKTQINGISCGEVSKIFKQDEYFSRYETREERNDNQEPQVIRIRTDNDGVEKKSYFTIKRKVLKDGIEVNKEDETFIEDASVLKDLFQVSGYKRWFNKEKDVYSCHCQSDVLENVDFHIELETVNNLKYVEIEVTEDSHAPETVTKALNEFVIRLGLNPEKKDSRSWVSIINGN